MKRVYFHIGAPKTGSTFLQSVLWRLRAELAADGTCYPLYDSNIHLGATMDLCKRPWGGRFDPRWAGSWDRIAERTRAFTGERVVFSGELMGLAGPSHIERAVASVQPAEVHLVFTARDLARQIPSDWQEQMKHRHTVTLSQFVDDLVELGPDAPKPFGQLFWGLHDAPYVLARWRNVVPPERIHVVTIAQRGTAPPDQLWRRFGEATGIDSQAYDTSRLQVNTAMGLVEAEFLRRFNGAAVIGTLGSEHGPVINRVLGQDILARREGSLPIRFPRRHRAWAVARSRQVVDELKLGGYDVVGNLDELIPVYTADDDAVEQLPERLPPAVMNKAAFYAIAGLVRTVATSRARVRSLAARLAELSTDPADQYDEDAETDEDFDAAVERLRRAQAGADSAEGSDDVGAARFAIDQMTGPA